MFLLVRLGAVYLFRRARVGGVLVLGSIALLLVLLLCWHAAVLLLGVLHRLLHVISSLPGCVLLVADLVLIVLAELALTGLVLVARIVLVLVLHRLSELVLLSRCLILLVLGGAGTAHRGVRLAKLVHVLILRLLELCRRVRLLVAHVLPLLLIVVHFCGMEFNRLIALARVYDKFLF